MNRRTQELSAQRSDAYLRNVNASRRISYSSGPARSDRLATCLLGPGDEDYPFSYVRVEQATGKVYSKSTSDLVGIITSDSKTHTVTHAATSETFTGTRKAALRALIIHHNTVIRATRGE